MMKNRCSDIDIKKEIEKVNKLSKREHLGKATIPVKYYVTFGTFVEFLPYFPEMI